VEIVRGLDGSYRYCSLMKIVLCTSSLLEYADVVVVLELVGYVDFVNIERC